MAHSENKIRIKSLQELLEEARILPEHVQEELRGYLNKGNKIRFIQRLKELGFNLSD